MTGSSLERICRFLEALVSGESDLTRRLDLEGIEPPLSRLGELINQKVSLMHATVSGLSKAINTAAVKEAEGSFLLGRIARAVDDQYGEITRVVEVALAAGASAEVAHNLEKVAGEGFAELERAIASMQQVSTVVEQTVALMEDLARQSDKIGEVTQMISAIAKQTDLLSLNAAIEAARAGDKGQGFAVVAEEVRRLSDRTQSYTQEVSRIIGQLNLNLSQVVRCFQGTSGGFRPTEVHRWLR